MADESRNAPASREVVLRARGLLLELDEVLFAARDEPEIAALRRQLAQMNTVLNRLEGSYGNG